MSEVLNGVILVCDVRNFTSYTYKVGCEVSFQRIESFIKKLIEHAQLNNAEIINLTGDGFILSFRGHNKKENAIRTSLNFREIIKNINKEFHKNKEGIINIGIGLFEGSYTKKEIQIGETKHSISIGNSINIASKIENYTKKLMVDIITTKEIVDEMKEMNYSFLKMPSLKLEGIDKKYELYWLAPQNK